MSFQNQILATGLSSEAAKAIVGSVLRNGTSLGTTQATALKLGTSLNFITTVASGTGVMLPKMNDGDMCVVFNQGVNALLVYPQVGLTIDGGTVDAAVTVPANSPTYFWGSGSNNYTTTVVSASSGISALIADLAASTGSSLVGHAQLTTGARATPFTVQGALTRASSLLPMGLNFFDSFQRANTSLGNIGVSDSGHTWDLRGAYAGSYPLPAATGGKLTNGIFVSDPSVSTIVYATQTFANTVTRMGARVSFNLSTDVTGSTFAMLISANSNFLSDILHFTASRTSWALQVRQANGAFNDILTGSFSPNIPRDGSIHTFEITVNGRSVTVNLDGTLTSIYDSRVPSVIGPYAVWEHFYNTNPAADLLQIHSVWAGCSPTDTYVGNAQHVSGTGAVNFQGDIQAGTITATTGVNVGLSDVPLVRDGAGQLAQRNGTNPQTFRVYNTYTDASNYEVGFSRWNANVFQVGTDKLGTGTARKLQFVSGGSSVWSMETNGALLASSDNLWSIGNFGANRPTNLFVAQTVYTTAPNTQTGATYSIANTDNTVIANRAGTITMTLPTPSASTGRKLRFVTIQAQTVVSASGNVVPLAGGAAGTAILAATAGKWADLECDGSNWIITASN